MAFNPPTKYLYPTVPVKYTLCDDTYSLTTSTLHAFSFITLHSVNSFGCKYTLAPVGLSSDVSLYSLLLGTNVI